MIARLTSLWMELKSVVNLTQPVLDLAVTMIQCRAAHIHDDAQLLAHSSVLSAKIQGTLEILLRMQNQSRTSMLAFMFTDLIIAEVHTHYGIPLNTVMYPGFYVSRPGFVHPENYKKFLAGELQFKLTNEEAAEIAATTE